MTDDPFDDDAVEFDRWNRYMLYSPHTYRKQPWTRVTTFARAIVNTFALNEWQQRMVVKGLSLRPDLLAKAATLDVKKDRQKFNSIVEQAKKAAGGSEASKKGTEIHALTEHLDAGDISLSGVPDKYRPGVSAYVSKMESKGVTTIPHLMERIVCIPNFSVAGRFDRVARERNGQHVIADVKTGASFDYNQLEIAIQLSLYAHGLNSCGIYDPAGRRWIRPGTEGVPLVSTAYALVMHIPAEGNTCDLHRVDIVAGWEAAQACAGVREWQRRREFFSGYEAPTGPADPVDPGPPDLRVPVDWDARFQAVSSRQEARELFEEARSALGSGSEKLASLVRIGMDALQNT